MKNISKIAKEILAFDPILKKHFENLKAIRDDLYSRQNEQTLEGLKFKRAYELLQKAVQQFRGI